MALERAAFMQSSFGSKISILSRLRRNIAAKVMLLAIKRYLRLPLTFKKADTKNSVAAIASPAPQILRIDSLLYTAQIHNSIVIAHPINVVNLVVWPNAMNPKPNDAVRFESVSVNADLNVAAMIQRSSDRANHRSSRICFHAANKVPIFRVVLKQFADASHCSIGVSHEALQMLIGQRPRRVSSTLAASSF